MLQNNGSSSNDGNNNKRYSIKYGSNRISLPNYGARDDSDSSQSSEESDESDEPENKENVQNETRSSLRELEDSKDIYKSISKQSSDRNKVETKSRIPSSPKKNKVAFGNESPKVISNPWSFFNRNVDKQEHRYANNEEELKGKMPYSSDQENYDEYDSEAKYAPHAQTFSSFFPTMFSSRSYSQQDNTAPTSSTSANNGGFQPIDEGNKQQKFKRKFQFFGRKKKDRGSKRYSVTAVDAEGEADDSDHATGERARQLIASLALGAPAINLLASCLLEDEQGIARAPLLLTLLGLKVTDISPNINTKIRKFKIDLEYGVGSQRLKWSVDKTAKDLLYLHSKFKFERWRNEVVGNKITELPKYPIPPLRYNSGESTSIKFKSRPSKSCHSSVENVDLNNCNDEEYIDNTTHLSTSQINENNSIFSSHTLKEQFANLRSHLSNTSSISLENQSPEQVRSRIQKNQEYIKDVTNYLNDLTKLVALTPQSNRLFQFFEISPISSLLSYETGYAGKQGVIHVGGTAKSQGWRVGHFKANDLKGMIDRRSEKWLLVRNSYVMYVSDINSTLPLEIFLVDSKFKIHFKGDVDKIRDDDESDYDDSSLVQKKLADIDDIEARHKNVFKHLKITLENSERKMVLIPKSRKEQKLWIKSLIDMKNSTTWSETHRFGSFAPVRDNCFAQWFVDGRDYFWAISSALEMAKDVIFIHDWWLSPELYLRRPANGNQQWRIDRILQRKAQQGVKIFVIVYRNVGTTVATDSLYTKHSILSLNEQNIHVIRSPNQLLQNTYFWAHHEKLCVIDQTVAFLGGIDLCYGRYDTPDHVLVDDSKIDFDSLDSEYRPTSEEFIKFQTFPGKDYSNPRVKDFYALDKPYESMYDRNAIPRMPWHDIHMVTSGKIARDLARHFVQRWNYLLRQKRPSRLTPLLTPPPDLSDEEAKQLGLDGTCEIQLLRSAGNWSLGLKQHEQSIQNAYLKLIETSEHFVYIENQFFVTSCFIDGNEIHNRIGDALADRIIKAHNEGTNWKAIIVIPLMPGFESQVDEPDGSSVRVIMQCQYMSISRGNSSIFAKLRKYGIEPDDYIQFFSLRKWGRIGPDRTLVTEQLYIHAKTMIVDDRAAIIGSANINERSMRGIRDSEVAAIVRDKETITTKMDGKTFLAGKFAHTLRMRLMREHLGVNVDILDIVERRFKRFEDFARIPQGLKAATSKLKNHENIIISAMVELASRDILNEPQGTYRWKHYQQARKLNNIADEVPLDDIKEDEEAKNIPTPLSLPISFNNRTGTHEANRGIRDKKKHSYDARVQHNAAHKKDVYGEGLDKYKSKLAKRARLNSSRFLKDLAHISMQENPTGIFLPDINNVKEFLESDDCYMVDEMDEESERIITERNKERWNLLKKISYLQRVAAKEKEEREEESKKRVEAGMEPTFSTGTSPGSSGSTSTPEPDSSKTFLTIDVPVSSQNISQVEGTSATFDSQTFSPPSSNDKKPAEPSSTETYAENIPIVSLNEQAARDLIQSINSKGIEKFSTFIDPYIFEDPLDDEFYEDLWYEHARRNTEIFRMVFHTQPDDFVVSWKDYKQFSKFQRAFLLSQQQEAKYRRQKRSFGSRSLSDESDTDEETTGTDFSTTIDRRNSQATINVKKLDQDVGLLGQAPPSVRNSSESVDNSSQINKNQRIKFRRHFNNKDDIPEQNEDEEPYNEGNEIFEDAKEEQKEEQKEEHNGQLVPLTLNNHRSEVNHISTTNMVNGNGNDVTNTAAHGRRRRAATFTSRRRIYMGERIFERDSAERILSEVQGNLVFFPYDWLMRELEGDNWFYNTDRIPPIDIYD